ncbi:hypothetical protein TSUD_387680 [Trifolium subterraneum]|uniref:Uncharacterized protein n=1 Tax=Trifolium subterraneum TaxID=3900 RepID=A0A2Z6MXM6_TRISU|nr:hypothetical protein TSUD_387680 [Trifolium subterraneum]
MGDLEKQQEKVMVVEEGRKEEEKEGDEKERLLEGTAVLDFDMLCSSVALQTANGSWGKLGGTNFGDDEQRSEEFGGVLRMWEGELLDCFEHQRIAVESACCPCYRFGKNMKRAGLGSCFIQAFVYFLLAICALFNFIAFIVTRHHYFLYLGVTFVVTGGAYLGFYRTRMRKKFNIKESRTLEINNVQDGTWHGRGDTLCIGGLRNGNKAVTELIPPPIESIKLTDGNYTL